MELKLEYIKQTLIRLQGQMDVWTNLYQAVEQAEKSKEVKNDAASQS